MFLIFRCEAPASDGVAIEHSLLVLKRIYGLYRLETNDRFLVHGSGIFYNGYVEFSAIGV